MSGSAEVPEVRPAVDELRAQLRLLHVVEQLPALVWTIDCDLRFTSSQGSALRPLGLDVADWIGRSLQEFFATDDPDYLPLRAHRAALDGESVSYELEFAGHAFETHVGPLREDGEIVGAIGAALDVTERRQLEGQLAQVQKLDALGRLAGGIAHDFNNLLTVIVGSADMLLLGLDPASPHIEEAREIAEAARRASDLTRQLLAVSRKQVRQPRAVDLNALVEDVRRMLRHVIGENVVVTAALAPGLPPVLADPGQLEHVLLNLAVNARDAMPGGGTLTIATREAGAAVGSPFVTLSVADTGVGMDEETRAHIFEPFFTTKGVGEGTGLGLATVYGIVQQSGGDIRVSSEPGRGTTFEIDLPAAEASEPDAVVAPGDGLVVGRKERVLLVEDEERVREVVRGMLERNGYCVVTASSGAEALDVLEQAGSFDVLLTDVAMPGMSGRDVAQRARALQPGIAVLFASAYPESMMTERGAIPPDVVFVEKPFTASTLAGKLRVVLDARRPGPPSPEAPVEDDEVAAAFAGEIVERLSSLELALADVEAADSPAAAAGALARAERQAHGIAGAAAVAGHHEIAECAAELEEMLREIAAAPGRPRTLRRPREAVAEMRTLAPVPADLARTARPASGGAGSSRGIVLHVEDSRTVVTHVRRRLAALRPELALVPAPTAQTGLELARRLSPLLILLDLDLPDMPGEELIRRLRADEPTRTIPIAVLSGDAERVACVEGVAWRLSKPIADRQLGEVLGELLDGDAV